MTYQNKNLNYIEKLKGNKKLDLYACQVQIKHALEIEFNICKKNKTLEKFDNFQLLYENLEDQSPHYTTTSLSQHWARLSLTDLQYFPFILLDPYKELKMHIKYTL